MKLNKIKILPVTFITLAVSIVTLKAQNADSAAMYRTIRAQALMYAENLFVYRDYSYAVAHIYPPVVELYGGAEKMKTALKNDFAHFDELDNQGVIYYIEVAVGTTAIIADTALQLQCIIPDTMTVTIVSKQVTGKTTTTMPLLGISENGGRTWYFWFQGDDSYEKKKELIPTLSSRLKFLPNQKAVFHAKL